MVCAARRSKQIVAVASICLGEKHCAGDEAPEQKKEKGSYRPHMKRRRCLEQNWHIESSAQGLYHEGKRN